MKKIIKYIYNNWRRKKQRLELLSLDKPVYIDNTAKFNFHERIKIGKYCRIGPNCHLDGEGGINVGDGSIFGPKVSILSSSHNYQEGNLLPYGFIDVKRPVIIGKGCWLGWGVMVVPGVTIGNGSVIAMGSVVTKDIEAGVLAGGNPAKVIKKIQREIGLDELILNENYYLEEIYNKKLFRDNRSEITYKNLIIE